MLLVIFLSCKPAPVEIPELVPLSLTVEPETLTLTTGPGEPEPTVFTAHVVYSDGSEEDLAQADWTISNRSAGSITPDGTFTPSVTNGGITWVTARFDNLEATASVKLIYEDVQVDEGVDQRLFDNPKLTQDGLWTYPEDGVNIPRNTPSIEFQWAPIGAEAALLHFRSEVTDLAVYTTGDSWVAAADVWPLIVASNAGGSVQVELSLAVGGQVLVSPVRTLHVNRMDAQGSIFYWSTSTSGIMEIPYGGNAVEYLTPSSTGHCVGCHTVRNGRIAFTYDGGNGSLGIKNLSDGSDILAYGSGALGNFQSFSPDGRYLLSVYMAALWLYDAQTGQLISQIPTSFPVSHVDWSPTGELVAVTGIGGSYGCDWCFYEGNIAVMDYLGDGQFTDARVIYDAPAGYNAYYPAFSPDGQWIAFDVSTEDCYDDFDAAVWVISAEGGTPIELVSANQVPGITNSMPRWGPLPDDDVLWLAFSSKRYYGNKTLGNPQLWVAAFDPARAESGIDPSWPAFWLPGQDMTQNNHIPNWAER